MLMKNNLKMLIVGTFTFLFLLQYPTIACTLAERHYEEKNFNSPDISIATQNQATQVMYHTKTLDFREQILTENDAHLLTNGNYEEVDLSSTNIKNYGIALLKQSQNYLTKLELEDNSLDINDVTSLILFKNLEVLNLSKNNLKDNALELISNHLKNLRELNISYNIATSNGMSFLPRLQKVETLDCGYMKLGNDGISFISQISSLKEIFIPSTGLNDESLMYFTNLPNLETIDISYNSISLEALSLFKTKTNANVIAFHLSK